MTCGFLRLVFAIGAEGGKTKPPEERPHGKPIDLMENDIGGFAADGDSQYSRGSGGYPHRSTLYQTASGVEFDPRDCVCQRPRQPAAASQAAWTVAIRGE